MVPFTMVDPVIKMSWHCSKISSEFRPSSTLTPQRSLPASARSETITLSLPKALTKASRIAGCRPTSPTISHS